MKPQNQKKLSGTALRSTAEKISKKIKYHQRAYYMSDGKLVGFRNENYIEGKHGDYGFSNEAAKKASENPGFIFIG